MRKFTMAMMMLALFTASIFAQSNTGRLVGTVSSPDGVLPGATVVLTDTKSGKERTVTTTESGGFSFPQLDPGLYTVKVTVNGFKTATKTGVEIIVGQEYSLPITLEVGNISETVTVSAGQDIVNSSNPELSQTVSSKQLTELPLNGRNPLNLVLLQAGTASNPNQNTAINGQRTSFTNIVRDGINIQDNFIRSNATDFAPGRPSVDDVSEFTLTTQSDASRGFGGPQVELVTPRGQNEFRGTGFWYNRNSKFGANSWFNNAAGNFGPNDPLVLAGLRVAGAERNPRAFRNRNQFGGNFSGPIIKKRLFFFSFYERLTDRLPVNKLTTVLTPSARAGIFRYTDSTGAVQSVNLFGLPTTAFAPGNSAANGIPTTINTAVVSRFINPMPAGNSIETGDGLNTTGYRFSQKSDQNSHKGTVRIDFEINDRNSVNGVYNRVIEENLRSDIDGSFNTVPEVIQPSINNFLALAWRSTFSNNFVNEVRGGYFFSKPDFLRTKANPANFFGIGLGTNPEVTFQEQGRYVKTYNLQDNADYIWGNHSLRFGGQMQRVTIDAYNDVGIVPTYSLGVGTNTPQITTASFTNTALFPGTVPTAFRGTANALYGTLAGIVTAGSQSFNATTQTGGYVSGATQSRQFKYNAFSGYLTDSWRVNSNMTLNLGVRYDLYTGLEAVNGLALEPKINSGQDPVQAILDPNGVYQFIGGNAGKANRFYKTDKNNFSPVLGFAWSLPGREGLAKWLFGGEGKTIIRGGFRYSYVNDELVRAPDNALLGNAGLNFTASLFNPATGTTALNERFTGVPGVPVPTYTPIGSRTYASNNAAAGLFGTVFGVDPNIQSPRTTEYMFGFQREIGWDTALEVRYVGGRSKNLLRGIDYNQVDITSNGFLADFNRARANFLLTGNAACVSAGCQPLTVFPNLAGGGLLTNATVTGQLVAGTPADLAIIYVTNALAGTVRFLPNPNTGVADLLLNGAEYNYNALQIEARRRYSNGFVMQANYTFSKTLTDAQGTGQTRFEPLVDNARPELEYSRADFDQTHVFNFNALYELPFGKGKMFLNDGKWQDLVFGGWQLNAILRMGSGSPITFTDARGTFNRAGRSGRQTALTSLTKKQLKELVGVWKTPCGVYFINPAVTTLNTNNLYGGNCSAIGNSRGSNGFGQPLFAGQVFFNNNPGQTSGLERAVVNGPTTFNVDLSMFKNIKFGERMNLQLRGELFNAFNNVYFIPGQFLDINSATFGRVGSTNGSRVAQFAARFSF